MVRSILVVCLGNMCRSPMAEGLLRRALPGCEVHSAGLAPPVGAAADPRAVRLLAREGLDLRRHRARAVNDAMLSRADLVLVMDEELREELVALFPHAAHKTHRLCEFIPADVPDPYTGSQQMFALVLELIRQGITAWSARLQADVPAVLAHTEAEGS